MKYYLFILLFWSICTSPLVAQDWNLLNASDKLSFLMPGDTFASATIAVDSTRSDGSDSIFWLSPPKIVFLSSWPYSGKVGNFLGDSIVKHADGIYELRFKPKLYFSYPQNTNIIQTKTEVGSSWEIEAGITATVVEKKDTILWGFQDSLKTISLSDGKTIRLSKRFGIFYINTYSLVGLEGRNIGVQLPKHKDFYECWTAGAIFEKKYHSTVNYKYTNDYWTKYYVLGKTITPDSIIIRVRKLERYEYSEYDEFKYVIFKDDEATISFVNPDQVWYPGVYQEPSTFYTRNTYGEAPEGLKLTAEWNLFSTDLIPNIIDDYVLGLGIIKHSSIRGGADYSEFIEEKLIGYQKVGEAVKGEIHPDDFFKLPPDHGWFFINPANKINFNDSNYQLIGSTIVVDSVATSGTDSIFWMSPQKAVFSSDYPYIGFVGNILGDSIVKHSDGSYQCRFRPFTDFPYTQETTCTIWPNASIGTSWTFRPGVTAYVRNKRAETLWGVQDSIKEIMAGGNMIKISKHFGVITFLTNVVLGLEGQNLGMQLTKQKEWYQDWVAGAVFEVSSMIETEFVPTEKKWTKYYVLGQTVSADKIAIKVRKLQRTELYTNYQLDTILFVDKKDTILILNPDEVKYAGTFKYPDSSFRSGIYYNSDIGVKYQLRSVFKPVNDTLLNDDIYVMGLGPFYHEYKTNHLRITDQLSGYLKVGQTEEGMIHPDSFYGVEPMVFNTITVFPNPSASGIISLGGVDFSKVKSIEYLDLSGKVLKTIEHPGLYLGLSTADLHNGVYLVRIRLTDEQVVVRKVMIR